MTPFQLFRKLVSRVGLFGLVTRRDLDQLGYKLSSEEIARLALTELDVEERDVLIHALSVKNVERIFDAERNRTILEKAKVRTDSEEAPKPSTFIAPDKEALAEILDNMSEEFISNTAVNVEDLIAKAVKEPNPITKKIGTLEIPQSSK